MAFETPDSWIVTHLEQKEPTSLTGFGFSSPGLKHAVLLHTILILGLGLGKLAQQAS
jgi:hypothetical protein